MQLNSFFQIPRDKCLHLSPPFRNAGYLLRMWSLQDEITQMKSLLHHGYFKVPSGATEDIIKLLLSQAE